MNNERFKIEETLTNGQIFMSQSWNVRETAYHVFNDKVKNLGWLYSQVKLIEEKKVICPQYISKNGFMVVDLIIEIKRN